MFISPWIIFKERVIAISLLLGVEHGEQDHTASQEYQALKVKHEAEAREECKSNLQLNLQWYLLYSNMTQIKIYSYIFTTNCWNVTAIHKI